jgi:POT family proton-dependent oligopeptide transporter
MPDDQVAVAEPETSVIQKTIREITQPFIDLVHASRALWGINLSYLLEGLTYFGVVGLLAIYFNNYVGLNDIQADGMVGFLTAGITLAMLFLGATVDLIGARKAILISLAAMMVGRILLAAGPAITGTQGMWSSAHWVAIGGILGIVLGYGIYQPACYAAVRFFTPEKAAAMGYAMLYALMNLGGFLPGLISPPVRKAYGITGVFWVYVALTLVGIIIIAVILTKKAMRDAMAQSGWSEEKKEPVEEKKSIKEQAVYYIKNFPIRDYRFMFFIFALIPVQTLFAHNWLTLPQYFSRAFTGVVSSNFEFFVNFNPILIFILTPMVAALTTKSSTYTMMIVGTFVMASPTFILAFAGPNIYAVFAYLIIMTIGEAMWSPRFLQWVAEIAPKNMTGIYMGIGQFPWFLTKVITSLYSGWFLMHFCPEGVPPQQLHTQTMWFIYGLIAILTPVGLWLARRWMVKGFKVKYEG